MLFSEWLVFKLWLISRTNFGKKMVSCLQVSNSASHLLRKENPSTPLFRTPVHACTPHLSDVGPIVVRPIVRKIIECNSMLNIVYYTVVSLYCSHGWCDMIQSPQNHYNPKNCLYPTCKVSLNICTNIRRTDNVGLCSNNVEYKFIT